MNRGGLVISFILFQLIWLSGCKQNTVNVLWNNDGPDSLFSGRKYKIQIPKNFPAVADHLADSLSYEGVELGRRLFYDKHLSADGKKSCASCHALQFAFSDSGKAVSENETGHTIRNAPALQNLVWNKLFSWDGRLLNLSSQADDAAHKELAIASDITISYLISDSTYRNLFRKAFGRPGSVTAYKMNKALEQFLISLVSANSKFDRVKRGEEQFSASEARGFKMFSNDTGGCFRCHNSNGGYTLLMTDNEFRNNGLDAVATAYQYPDSGRGGVTHVLSDYGKFKVPSLRNVAVTGPYMHEGRYKTLQQVVNFYSDSTHLSPSVDPIILFLFHGQKGHHLTAAEKNDLIDFLGTLTDSSFINNKVFANPFGQ